MFLTCQSVCKTIRHSPILKNVSLTMHGGAIYGLEGKKGSGKTMLMKLLCGLIYPSSGWIEIDGQRHVSLLPSTGVLFEKSAFIPGETGFKNLEMINALANTPISKEEIRATLRQVGLGDNDPRPYRKFSPGMQQRLGIAAAIMGFPRLVVLDKPTASLGSDGILLMRKICTQLKNHGCLVVLSCHDSEELYLLCDFIFSMKDGEIAGVQHKTAGGEWIDMEEKNVSRCSFKSNQHFGYTDFYSKHEVACTGTDKNSCR